jgi:hypothetical protein
MRSASASCSDVMALVWFASLTTDMWIHLHENFWSLAPGEDATRHPRFPFLSLEKNYHQFHQINKKNCLYL